MTTAQSAPAGAETTAADQNAAATTKRVTLDPIGIEFKHLADYLQQRLLIRASEVGELAAKVAQLTELLEATPDTAAAENKPKKD